MLMLNCGEWMCLYYVNFDGVYFMYVVFYLMVEDLMVWIECMKCMEREFFDADLKSTANKRRMFCKCFMCMEVEFKCCEVGGVCDCCDVVFCCNFGCEFVMCVGDCMGFWGFGYVIEKSSTTFCGVDAMFVE